MSLLDLLDETKRWAVGTWFPLFQDGPPWTDVYPPVDLTMRWEEIEDATTSATSREIIDTFRGYLAASPKDVAVRWTVLSCLYVIATHDFDEDGIYGNPYWNQTDWLRFREELVALVRLPAVDHLTDPRVIRWEIINSCMVSDFNRAERLFERLEDVETDRQAHLWAVRGQYHFWRSLTREDQRDPFLWTPVLFPANNKYALRLARWGVGLDDTPRWRKAVERARKAAGHMDSDSPTPHLREAAHFFQKSLDAGFELSSVHRAVLARCFLVDGHYARAADNYRTALSRGLVLDGNNATHNDELMAYLYVASADAVKRSHDPAAAKALLRECLEKHPSHAGAWRRLAELYAGEANYEDAFKVLDRWVDAQPDLEADIWVKTLRALGRVEKRHDWRRVLDEFFLNHPERLAAVRQTVESHWPAFNALGEESSKEWLYGCFRLWWATPGYESVHYAAVVHHFTVAVEIELREKVFRPFLEDARKSGALLRSIGQRTDPRAKRWRTWLEHGRFKSPLGDMFHELDPSRRSDLEPWRALQAGCSANTPVSLAGSGS